ncbi:hypothetical protein R6Q59_001992 [Mikania micrantha]|uniref:Uncharacterized protein n=1 Tax=Mikania micrantha TaxID=192012 RepID=A0A5N6NQ51_9ASTR|nr:hypothetical protein E3N88_19063 [Mikania micrantha]
MAKPTSQWVCIVILALMGSTFTMAHMVKLSRKLLMDKNGEPEPNLDSAAKTVQHHSQVDITEVSASGCGGSREDKEIYGGGQGSGVTSIGFQRIFPFPGFPFAILVPQVTTWGEGGGYGGSDNRPGVGVNCPCAHNTLPIHYVITPVYSQPMKTASLDNMKCEGPCDLAPGPSGN